MLMTPQELNAGPLALALTHLGLDSLPARALLIAIALQESGLATRQQTHGPAHGLWQFEAEGVSGVLRHPASSDRANALCRWRNVEVIAVYHTLLSDDVLAAGIARLLLWTDPAPLPALGEVDAALQYYLRNWRPGKPRPEAFSYNYHEAIEAIRAV
jgi:hypothetical protein